MYSTLGCVLLGIGISFLKLARFGNDPLSAANYAFSFLFKESGVKFLVDYQYVFGALALNLIFFIPFVIFLRDKIGLGTLMCVFGEGLVVQLVDWIFASTGLSDNPNMAVRLVFLVLGFFIICFGAALFIQADFGIGPYDAFCIICGKKITYKFGRMISDFACIVMSVIIISLLYRNMYTNQKEYFELLFNSDKTVVSWFTFAMLAISGPVISFFGKFITKHIIKKSNPNI